MQPPTIAPLAARSLPFVLPSSLARVLLGLLVGSLLFGLLLLELPAAPLGLGAEVWVADRDADELVGLDGDGFLVRRIHVRAPVALSSAPGGPFVVSAREAWALGEHALWKLGLDGRRLVPLAAGLGPVLDLETLPDGGALVVEFVAGGASRVLRTPGAGTGAAPVGGLATVVELTGATCAAGRLAEGPGALGLEILVGDEAGGLSLVRDGEVVAVRELGGEVGDLAPGPGGTWFALDLASRRLVLLDRDLGLLWAVDHGLAALELAPVVGEERVWLVDSTEPLVRRYGPGGGLEVEAGMPAADATGATDDGQGGLWVASAGALLRLDVHGAVQPGQGGFGHLTDVSRTP